MTKAHSTSGLEIRARRIAGAETVSMRLWLRGGSRCEEKPGQAWLTGRMLMEGTRRRDWQSIARESDDLGMVLTSFGGLESHGLRVDCLERDWRQGLAWLAELAQEPVFPPDRLRWVYQQGVAELDSLRDQPDVTTGWAFAEQLYHPHASGRPIQGSPESLARMTPEDCVRFHEQGLRSGVVLAVAGGIDEEEVRRFAERDLGGLEIGKAERRPVPRCEGLAATRRCVETQARDQAHLFLGHVTVPLEHPDYRALQALSVVLGAGAGLCGRIPSRVRESEGLAYTAFATAVAGAGLDPGRLVVVVATSPASVERAGVCVREELTRLLDFGIDRQELEDARSYLVGREAFRRETARQWADLDGQAEFYGLPLNDPDWLESGLADLGPEDLLAVARRHISPEDLKMTVGSPATGSPATGSPAT